MLQPQELVNKTILLVDDSPINLELLKETLGGLGYRLLDAINGETALDVVRNELPDLILLDIMMPGMDGFEVCRHLREDPRTEDVPIIFLSALDELKDRVRGLEEGAVDYISKPFRLEEVVARVNTHLTINDLQKKLQKQRDELEHELQQVADAQRSLLPKQLPQIDGLSLAISYETSRYAGGDLYDVLPLADNCWGLLVADVEGHSTQAAVLMAMSCALLRSFPGDGRDPVAVLDYLNTQLCKVSDSRMVTALYAVYDANRKDLRIARAGHLQPLLYRPSIGVREIFCEGIYPMGLKSYDGEHVPVEEVKLQSGDQMLFYTDGLIERFDCDGLMYGVERLSEQLGKAVSASPQEKLQQIYADVADFVAGRPADDDQTLLLVVVD
ncbi:Response regulator receiver domain-containing protein [Malonomonas rubra DSM 5091]|uniref:Response regulator receiver domain-containing protein n=1 Tax=Malonomonas rubra DSM 5091 TaxID=1122189 RepID=A0A1M6EWW8_MALRU|nr:SpoIIE family protein phosphatase [Malonomonas rubra]SHI89922.1 Response regulator receiver domain-containing protein [Malonomonas rubra DSM 5091]